MLKKIAILGCGWLGLPLATTLVAEGYTVYGSTTTKEKLGTLSKAGIQPFYILATDTLEGENIGSFFEAPLLILNIPPKRNLPNIETLYPTQVACILKAAHQGKVKNIIFVSSTGVYPDNNQLATESSPVEPSKSNTKGLVIAEQLVQTSSFNSTILRMAGLIGGSRKAGRFFAGKTDLPEADAPVNLVHLEDAIGVIRAVIEQNYWGEIFNVCADQHPSKKDFYTTQTLREGLELPQFLASSIPSSFKIVSNQKVKEQLGYHFIHPDPMSF
jgi:nucleoside-diphosphate-sugar epimerase